MREGAAIRARLDASESARFVVSALGGSEHDGRPGSARSGGCTRAARSRRHTGRRALGARLPLFDLGDFLDDYREDKKLRNHLGLLFLVDPAGSRLEAIPLKLEFAFTRLAEGEVAAWIRRRFTDACAAFGTEVAEEDGRLVTTWR